MPLLGGGARLYVVYLAVSITEYYSIGSPGTPAVRPDRHETLASREAHYPRQRNVTRFEQSRRPRGTTLAVRAHPGRVSFEQDLGARTTRVMLIELSRDARAAALALGSHVASKQLIRDRRRLAVDAPASAESVRGIGDHAKRPEVGQERTISGLRVSSLVAETTTVTVQGDERVKRAIVAEVMM